jgi:alpha-tubulin suppressor-like RCC1 family protein
LDENLKFIFSPTLNSNVNKVTKVKIGLKHSIFITNNGIYGCGDNSKGALGVEDNKLEFIKNKISKLSRLDNIWNIKDKITQIKTSWNNTYILTSNFKE